MFRASTFPLLRAWCGYSTSLPVPVRHQSSPPRSFTATFAAIVDSNMATSIKVQLLEEIFKLRLKTGDLQLHSEQRQSASSQRVSDLRFTISKLKQEKAAQKKDLEWMTIERDRELMYRLHCEGKLTVRALIQIYEMKFSDKIARLNAPRMEKWMIYLNGHDKRSKPFEEAGYYMENAGEEVQELFKSSSAEIHSVKADSGLLLIKATGRLTPDQVAVLKAMVKSAGWRSVIIEDLNAHSVRASKAMFRASSVQLWRALGRRCSPPVRICHQSSTTSTSNSELDALVESSVSALAAIFEADIPAETKKLVAQDIIKLRLSTVKWEGEQRVGQLQKEKAVQDTTLRATLLTVRGLIEIYENMFGEKIREMNASRLDKWKLYLEANDERFEPFKEAGYSIDKACQEVHDMFNSHSAIIHSVTAERGLSIKARAQLNPTS
ncbi:hypothetical protein HDU96_004565 [Phlyctochytrium bullatum]|nr:hypothetical protein HDU96_004565 [Phlyctochytrium bullatum]